LSGNRQDGLAALFNPNSVAVVGASDDPRKWGNWLAKGALRGEGRRPVYLVNAARPTVLGRRSWPRTTAIGERVDLAVLAVPVPALLEAVDDALAAGARAIVAITAGLAEVGAEGALIQQQMVERVRQAGAVLLGPNCLGIYDAASDLYLTSNDLPPGPIALLSQSGNLALELGELAREQGLGFRRFVSLGNQADVTLADVLYGTVDAPDIRAVAVYCEDFGDGRRFLEACAAVMAHGVPVAVLSVGSGQAAVRAAKSHTGALVSNPAVVEAACRTVGAVYVRTPGELMDALQLLAMAKRPQGRRLGILADGGGHGALAADAAERLGLAVPALAEPVRKELAHIVSGSTSNPVDMAGAGEADLRNFTRALDVLAQADTVDVMVLSGYFGGYGVYGDTLATLEQTVARDIGALAQRQPKPVIVHSMHRTGAVLDILRATGVPVYPRIDQALTAVVRSMAEDAAGVPPLPPPAHGDSAADYFAARRWLMSAGIPFPTAYPAMSPDEAARVADELGYPVVLKAAHLLHKSDAGGVVLGLAHAEAVRQAAADLQRRLGPGVLSVERQVADDGAELVVGARWDPRFGPVVMVGLGGIYVEVFNDVVLELAPVSQQVAEAMIRRLRAANLLTGARGRHPLDIAAAADAIARLSGFAAAHPEYAEVEVNPLRVFPVGVVALDARFVLNPRHVTVANDKGRLS
jgi:acyl-CoA synthetase (NDP forming)